MSDGAAPVPCCASDHHQPVVLATVRGKFHYPFNSMCDVEPVYYCDECAQKLERGGWFTPDRSSA